MRLRRGSVTSINGEVCRHCGGSNLSTINRSETVEFRNLELNVEKLKKTTCNTCGSLFETDEQSIENQNIIKNQYSIERDRIRSRDGLLSGNEIFQIRTSFSLNQRDAAFIFGGGYNAFNKYESGEVLQSVAMDRLLRLVRAAGQPALSVLQKIVQLSRSEVPAEKLKLSHMRFDVDLSISLEVKIKNRTFNVEITSPEKKKEIVALIKNSTYIHAPTTSSAPKFIPSAPIFLDSEMARKTTENTVFLTEA